MLSNMKNIYFAVDEELEKILEEYRAAQRPVPSRSEAIRELVKLGLQAKGYAAPD